MNVLAGQCASSLCKQASARTYLSCKECPTKIHHLGSIFSHGIDLSQKEYKSNAQKVSSREFDATHTKKYVNPTTFRHALWNAAELPAGAMISCLDIIKDKL